MRRMKKVMCWKMIDGGQGILFDKLCQDLRKRVGQRKQTQTLGWA